MLDGVVTLVDGPALAGGGVAHDLEALERQRAADNELDHDSPIDELFKDQISAANLIILSKADMLDDVGIERARAAVEAHLDNTPIITIAGGKRHSALSWGWIWKTRRTIAPSITTTIMMKAMNEHGYEHGHDELPAHNRFRQG